jgi:hypothetical protein
MASTYVNDLRLNEMATGDASGSWGTVTNTNLELIGEAFSYGTETIGDADSTLTIADGAADPARSFYPERSPQALISQQLASLRLRQILSAKYG